MIFAYSVIPLFRIPRNTGSPDSQQSVVPNQPSLSSEVDYLSLNDISSEPVNDDFAPDEAVDGAGPSAVAVTTKHLLEAEQQATTEAEQATTEVEMQSMDEIAASSGHSLDPAVSCGDFHRVVNYKNNGQRELTDHEKHYFLNHHFIPSATYKFPAHTFRKQQRHFQHSWLT